MTTPFHAAAATMADAVTAKIADRKPGK